MHQTLARAYAVPLQGVRLVTAAALVLLVLVVSAAVVVRYFGLFGGSLHWATELSRLTIVWVAMLGSVVAFDQGRTWRLPCSRRRSRPAPAAPSRSSRTCSASSSSWSSPGPASSSASPPCGRSRRPSACPWATPIWRSPSARR